MTLRSFYKFITFFTPIELKTNATKRASPMMTLLSNDEIFLKGSVITKVKTEKLREIFTIRRYLNLTSISSNF